MTPDSKQLVLIEVNGELKTLAGIGYCITCENRDTKECPRPKRAKSDWGDCNAWGRRTDD